MALKRSLIAAPSLASSDVLRRPERERRLSGLRQWLSHWWEPVLNGVLLVVFVAALLLAAWASYYAWGARWLSMCLLGFVVLVRLIATRFSQSLLRAATVAVLVILAGGVISVGRAEEVATRRREARAAATRLGRETAVLLADPRLASAQDANARARATVDALTTDVAAVSDPAAKLVGGEIVGELKRGLTDDPLGALSRVADLQKQLPAEPPPAAGANDAIRVMTTQLGIVVDAMDDLAAATEIQSAIPVVDLLCDDGDGVPEPQPQVGAGPQCGPRGKASGHDLRAAPNRGLVALHQADAGLHLARAESAVARDAAVGPARQTVDTREQALADALARSTDPTRASQLVDILREGANAVVRRLPLVDRRDVPLGLALTGWLVVVGVAIIGYRHLEIINGADGLGPVRVKGPDDDVEQFRTYLLWNVREPGAVPGASALKPVTDLLGATASGVPGAAWLQRVIDAVTAAIAIDHGYTVEFDVLPQAADGDVSVAVRVHVTRTGEMVGQHVAIRPTKKSAERAAAYWAAAVILDRSRKVPDWAAWSADTADSLAAYFEPADEGGAKIDRLRDAVRRAPTSGVLALDLANAEAIRKNQLRAFQLALRVATLHPRYVAGRYRLAVSTSLLASDLAAAWDGASKSERDAVIAALARYPRTTSQTIAALEAAPGDSARAAQLCSFALAELDALGVEVTRRRAAFKALRQRERSYWFDLMRPVRAGKSLRGQFQESIESCRPSVKARGGLDVDDDEVLLQRNRSEDRRTLWLVPYNLACCYAIWQGHGDNHPASEPGEARGDHAAEAVRLLEMCVERPGSHQLNPEWVDADPDLDSLRDDERFLYFRRNLLSPRAADPTAPPADGSGEEEAAAP